MILIVGVPDGKTKTVSSPGPAAATLRMSHSSEMRVRRASMPESGYDMMKQQGHHVVSGGDTSR